MGKRSYVSTYRRTRRGAKGVVSMRLKDSENVVGAIQIEKGDEILLTTEQGQMVRISADEIRTIGRASKGVRIMNLRDEDKITGVSKIVEVKDEDSRGDEEDSVPEASPENNNSSTEENGSSD
jgi:DNA gyrase subunit A